MDWKPLTLSKLRRICLRDCLAYAEGGRLRKRGISAIVAVELSCRRLVVRRQSGLVPLWAAVLLAALACTCLGCRSTRSVLGTSSLPARHSVRSDQLLILSDFKLDPEHPLIQDLIALRQQITRTLQLPIQTREVIVYLFSDESEYERFLQVRYPQLPPRRAYFVGTPKELAVYTFWGDRVQEDLRHEFTHGLLHASLTSVPLWLDEGLAEYFEVPGDRPELRHRDYARNLNAAVRNGWTPSLERLERLKLVQDMTRSDYQEAWAWIHLFLNESDFSPVLLGYLADLRADSFPKSLSERLREAEPQLNHRFLANVATMNPPRVSRVPFR